MTKLTDREKWLMQQAWNSSTVETSSSSMFDWLESDTGCNGANIEMLLEHEAPKPKSIVKTVDPDNLPSVEVIGWGDNMIMGIIHIENGIVICENDNDITYNVTRYIEQKDLIKLFK